MQRYLRDICLDTVVQIQALNAFQPSLRLIEKAYMPTTAEQPARLKRKGP